MALGFVFKYFGRLVGIFRGRRVDEGGDEVLADVRTAFVADDFEAAEQLIADILLKLPRNPEVLQLAGAIATERGDYISASQHFLEAISLAPRNSGLHSDYGNLLSLMEKLDDAEVEFRLAMQLDFGNVAALRGLTRILLVVKRYEEAYSFSAKLVAKDPLNPRSIFAHGFAAQGCYQFAEAYSILVKAGAMGEMDSLYYAAFAACAYNLQRPQEAESILRVGLEKFPENSDLRFQLAMTLLALGEWRDGFALYEFRYPSLAAKEPSLSGKRWRSMRDRLITNLPQLRQGMFEGERILILSEQGFGDLIMMLRFLPEFLARGAKRVAVVCPEAIFSLGEAMRTSGVELILARDDLEIADMDFSSYCFDMSTPFLLSITTEPFPGSVPYLYPPRERIHHWRARLAELAPSAGLMVGLAWAGNPELPLDSLRSFSLEVLAPLFSVRGVVFINLQKDRSTREEIDVSGYPMVDPMQEVADFLDTAAITCNLDLVISVDTVVAHLAGAVGRPVWLLNRFESEWRWQFSREDSPWYPTMRIFNQKESKNWHRVILEVAEELRALVGKKDVV